MTGKTRSPGSSTDELPAQGSRVKKRAKYSPAWPSTLGKIPLPRTRRQLVALLDRAESEALLHVYMRSRWGRKRWSGDRVGWPWWCNRLCLRLVLVSTHAHILPHVPGDTCPDHPDDQRSESDLEQEVLAVRFSRRRVISVDCREDLGEHDAADLERRPAAVGLIDPAPSRTRVELARKDSHDLKDARDS